jgi:hypothetical protein
MKLLTAIGNLYLWLSVTVLQIQPLNDFITKYIFADIGFLKWLVIAVGLDLLTGLAKVYKKDGAKGITSKGLRDTISKIIQYGAFLIITHVVTHFEIGGQKVTGDMLWINKLAMEFILIIEVKSVYENIVEINPKFDFVKKLLEKVVAFFPVKQPPNSEKDA